MPSVFSADQWLFFFLSSAINVLPSFSFLSVFVTGLTDVKDLESRHVSTTLFCTDVGRLRSLASRLPITTPLWRPTIPTTALLFLPDLQTY